MIDISKIWKTVKMKAKITKVDKAICGFRRTKPCDYCEMLLREE